jgi:hypothetical protein
MQRTYAVTRVEAGDYLVPSNSGAWVFRVKSYKLDGKTQWTIHRYCLPVEKMSDDIPRDFLDWDQWEYEEGGFATKRAAIDAAVVLR